jgi:hypothetical protein
MFKKDKDIELLHAQSEVEQKKHDAQSTAREVASKYIGKTAVPWIVLLVVVGVVASAFLDSNTLPAVVGLVSTAVMALIAMVTGITGTKEKEEKPEFKVIHELLSRLDKAPETMKVQVEDDKVVVTKGGDTIETKRV